MKNKTENKMIIENKEKKFFFNTNHKDGIHFPLVTAGAFDQSP